MRRIKLDKFAKLSYFLANLSLINSYIKDRINEKCKFNDIELYYFEEVVKMLEKNKRNINWTKKVNSIVVNIKFILLKENSSEDCYSYINNLFYHKPLVSEKDMLLALNFSKDKKCKFILKKIIGRGNNFFSYSDKTINAIKDYIDDDKWFDNLGEKKVETITKKLWQVKI